jgi:integrase
LFSVDELKQILESADPWLKAMTLLGINGGLGNSDVANLPKSAIDFENGWLDYPRPKTEIQRRIPLWQETLDALREAFDTRPNAKESADAGLCFLTVQGNRWVRVGPSKTNPNEFVTVDTVAGRFGRLIRKLEINGRNRLGFYTIRHTFETVAGASKDQVAVDAIMGHVDPSMAAAYREEISDDRLRAVVNHVHAWLFPPDAEGDQEGDDQEDEPTTLKFPAAG